MNLTFMLVSVKVLFKSLSRNEDPSASKDANVHILEEEAAFSFETAVSYLLVGLFPRLAVSSWVPRSAKKDF